MTTYIIAELQNAQSSRKGEAVQAANLTAAKRKASSMQMFQGTVMEIAAENGSVLSRKQDGKWIDSLANFRWLNVALISRKQDGKWIDSL